MQKPTHVWIGRYGDDNRVLAVMNDEPYFADDISEMIREGVNVEKITWEKYVNEVSKEPTFMKSIHEPYQLSLF